MGDTKMEREHIINRAYRTLLAACVYHIWKERNLRRFDHTERTPATLSILIINDVRQRILSVDLASSVSTRALYRLWRIPWDPWHHLGPLLDRFLRGPNSLGLHESTMLSSVICEGHWHWPLITDMECVEITHVLPQIHGGTDRIIWKGSSRKPTTQEFYRAMISAGPKVGWISLLLGSLKIPRHLFILWLAILEKLATTDKPWLSHLGCCVLCNEDMVESHNHLFFHCRFSRRCLISIRRIVRFQWPNRDWVSDVEWGARKWRGKHIINISYRCLLDRVYTIFGGRET
ncbi:UNVERIFIED_CONTAM: hypothetical protein Sindi_3000300 [Sesamum indicum]